MPIYDYACAACGHRFEVVHGVHGHGPEHCPNCGAGPVRKAFAPPTIMFKGSGWAKMDRRSNSGSGAARTGGDDAPGGSAKEGGDGTAAAPKTDASDGKSSKSSTGDGGASGSSSGSSATTPAD